MGGDGTIRAVIRGIAGSKVKLGIIAVGTENDIALSLGIPSDLKEACALVASGHNCKLDVGMVSTTKTKKFNFPMTMLVTVANTPLNGLKNLLAPGAFLDDGLLDIAVYSNFCKAKLLGCFAKAAKELPQPVSPVSKY